MSVMTSFAFPLVVPPPLPLLPSSGLIFGKICLNEGKQQGKGRTDTGGTLLVFWVIGRRDVALTPKTIAFDHEPAITS